MKLELRGVSHAFGGVEVLHDLSLVLDDTRCLVLIGPSGGGKSTLLRILAGLLVPDHGEVRVDDTPLPREEDALRGYRRRIGVVFQTFNLFPHLTALANITLPLVRVHRRTPAEAEAEARAYLDRFGLADHADKKPGQLSGGQRQRVAIVRAVAIKPAFLLFDEPTSALDPERAADVLEMIRELRGEDRALVLATHHLAFARTLADHAAFLHDGRLLEHGAAKDVFGAPRTPECVRFLDHVLRY